MKLRIHVKEAWRGPNSPGYSSRLWTFFILHKHGAVFGDHRSGTTWKHAGAGRGREGPCPCGGSMDRRQPHDRRVTSTLLRKRNRHGAPQPPCAPCAEQTEAIDRAPRQVLCPRLPRPRRRQRRNAALTLPSTGARQVWKQNQSHYVTVMDRKPNSCCHA